ncbi:MAG: short-chain dehydrogenase [Benniella sp.]|nr:MAG: short-chain dehydrogenase [Benniella sp.]
MDKPTLIVTGASRGIGKSIVLLAIKSLDANVIGIARSKEGLERISQELAALQLADRFKFMDGDIAEKTTADKAVKIAEESWSGQIHGLVHNAAVIDPLSTIANAPVDQWRKTFDINFFSVLTLVQLALPSLRENKGRIILVNSGAATYPVNGWGAYCSSKAALKMFGEILAKEESEVTTVSVLPGIVDTEMQTAIREKGQANMTSEHHAYFVDSYTNEKLLHPDDPGHVIAALAVNGASSLNGQFLSWDDEELKAYRQ